MKAERLFACCGTLAYCMLPGPVAAAVDESSKAYKVGQLAGKIFVGVLLALIVYKVVRRFIK